MGMEPPPANSCDPVDCPRLAEATPSGSGSELDGQDGLARDRSLRELAEQWVERDPSLVPSGPSSLLVEPSVLDPAEVQALLSDLGALLNGAFVRPAGR